MDAMPGVSEKADMATDENVIIEGCVKFREGRRWRARWCVVRKLSPAADVVQVSVWRDAAARRAGGGCKAALSLDGWVGAEAGFTLDRQSHTLALLCRAAAPVLALESRERLMQWQARLARHLPASRVHVVVVARGPWRRVPAGPARLHVGSGRAALVTGAPPRLLACWELAQLRRYGVVDGRFCLEGGALCGAGAGLLALVAERPHDIARDFELVTLVKSSSRSPAGHESETPEEGTRWPSPERSSGARLQRCRSCMAQLCGAARACPGGEARFTPAWTMHALNEAARAPSPPPPHPASVLQGRLPPTEARDHYDTPKRLRECAGGGGGGGAECGCPPRPPLYENITYPRSRAPARVHYENAAPLAHYLEMRPGTTCRTPTPAGYTPMSPVGGPPLCASHPALDGAGGRRAGGRRPRSSSADSSRFLDDVTEFEDVRGSACSLETRRDVTACVPACHVPGNRDSSSSNDSGVSVCARGVECARGGRRARSSEGAESRSTSSGASDLSDCVESGSLCSDRSRSSVERDPGSAAWSVLLRPRSGGEYRACSCARCADRRHAHCTSTARRDT